MVEQEKLDASIQEDRDTGSMGRAGRASRLSCWTARTTHALAITVLAVLVILYLIGDRHWLGAALAVWPPWFWAIGLVPLAVLGHRSGRGRVTVALLAAMSLFCVAFSEALLIFRRENGKARREFAAAHKRQFGRGPDMGSGRNGGIAVRVVCWNVAGVWGGPHVPLKVLAGRRADLCFIQEVWGGERDLPRAAIDGVLPGYEWSAVEDCGLLSHWPAERLEPIDLGSGLHAPVVRVAPPQATPITCINAHLPLYPLSFALHRPDIRARTRLCVAQRARAMKRLTAAVRKHDRDGPVIVAGDWNVHARAASMRPLARLLRDAFRAGGSGWGNTMTNRFPVSRIDAVFVSDEFEVVHCGAVSSEASDHRLVEAELWLTFDR